MKIVFIGCKDIHQLGGIEAYMKNLTGELTRLGHECVVFCETNENSVVFEEGVKIINQKGPRSPLLCKPWLGLKATIRTLLHEKGVDVVHYNAWPPSLWSWIPRLFGIQTVMQGHGLEWQRSKYSPSARKVLRLMERVTAHTNKHLIMCSEVQTRYFWEKYHKRATTIPTAIHLPAGSTGASDILDRYGLEPQRYFLFLGRLVQDKNPDYLIRAFRRCRHEGFKLVVAGSNEADKAYEAYLHQLGSGDASVVFTGAVYADDKDQLLRNAYTLCIPSTIEGLSIVLLEAMSYRLPIIASDIPANREPLGDNAVWVKPENEQELVRAIEYCIAGAASLQNYVCANYMTVAAKYTWDRVAQQYIAYIKAL